MTYLNDPHFALFPPESLSEFEAVILSIGKSLSGTRPHASVTSNAVATPVQPELPVDRDSLPLGEFALWVYYIF